MVVNEESAIGVVEKIEGTVDRSWGMLLSGVFLFIFRLWGLVII